MKLSLRTPSPFGDNISRRMDRASERGAAAHGATHFFSL
jgi:hypothetical protein